MLLAGCGKGAPDAPGASDAAPSEAASPATLAAPLPPPATPAVPARKVKESNDLYEFEYAYPAPAASIPGLAEVLDRRMAAAKRELTKGAGDDKAEAAKSGYPYRPHSSEAEWKVVTDLPRWLSLSDEGYVYTGGAHGMTFFDALLWDRKDGTAREPLSLFTGKQALSAAIRQPFCDLLDKEREKRRGEPVKRDSGDDFDECIDPVDSTVILGSTNGRTFDRIGILVGPYAAGAYAEGTYDLTLPVTAAVLRAVKPEFRTEFST